MKDFGHGIGALGFKYQPSPFQEAQFIISTSEQPALRLKYREANRLIAHSLEQVPMTGRWRFIDVTPQEEHKLEVQTYNELLKEYEGKILDPSHPVSVHVRQIVNRLLEASELGRVIDENDQGTPGDTWNGDSMLGDAHETHVPPPRRWKLLVVNDLTINAMASYGIHRRFSLINWLINPDGAVAYRHYCGVCWNFTLLQRR